MTELELYSIEQGGEAFVEAVIERVGVSDVGRDVARAIMDAPHTVDLDVIGAVEIGTLVNYIRRIDKELESGALDRELLELRTRLATRLRPWLKEFGLTPAARLELIAASE